MVVIGCNLTEMFGIVKDDFELIAGLGGVEDHPGLSRGHPSLVRWGSKLALLCFLVSYELLWQLLSPPC